MLESDQLMDHNVLLRTEVNALTGIRFEHNTQLAPGHFERARVCLELDSNAL